MSIGVVNLFNQLAQNEFGFFRNVNSIAEIMTKEVYTLTLDDTLQGALTLLERRNIHHAPVVSPEHDDEVVGIVSDRDLLRNRPRLLGTAAEGDGDHLALDSPLSQMMTRKPIHVSANSHPVDALSLMLDRHVDSLLVYDDPKALQGIVTPRDFIKTLLLYHKVCTRSSELKRLRLIDLDLDQGVPLDQIFARGAQTVRDMMTGDPVFLEVQDSVQRAIELMQTREIRHLPVVDENGQLAGMVSDREILNWLPIPQNRGVDSERQQEFRAVLFATEDIASLRRERIGRIMCSTPPTIMPNALLLEALAELQNPAVSGLPVVESPNNKLVGILTTTDVLRLFRIVMQLGLLRSADRESECSDEL